MIAAQELHAHTVARSLEQRITERNEHGVLDKETVLALDVLAHAISFARPRDGLALWREALWQRKLSEPSRAALCELLVYVVGAVARGELRAAAGICNCLAEVIGPDVFHAASAERAAFDAERFVSTSDHAPLSDHAPRGEGSNVWQTRAK